MASMAPPDPAAVPSCSLVLAAADPAALAAFYGALVAAPPQAGLSANHWRLPLPDGGMLELYAPSRQRPPLPAGGRLALCLRRSGEDATLKAWITAACTRGALLQEGPRQEPFGWEAWLQDPEGNPLLLLVTAA
jgi:hypothetical protein